jgi:toxin ParE1/3/4
VSAKPVVLRALARQDIEAAVDHYSAEAGERVALGFVAALEQALRHPAPQIVAG